MYMQTAAPRFSGYRSQATPKRSPSGSQGVASEDDHDSKRSKAATPGSNSSGLAAGSIVTLAHGIADAPPTGSEVLQQLPAYTYAIMSSTCSAFVETCPPASSARYRLVSFLIPATLHDLLLGAKGKGSGACVLPGDASKRRGQCTCADRICHSSAAFPGRGVCWGEHLWVHCS